MLVGLGTVLPDLTSRVPGLLMDKFGRGPDLAYALCDIGHMPVGAVLWAGLAAQLFAERGRAFGWILLGSGLHFALDVLQHHHGMGYRLFWPATSRRFELGIISSEATVVAAVPLLVVTGVVWVVVERRRAAKLR